MDEREGGWMDGPTQRGCEVTVLETSYYPTGEHQFHFSVGSMWDAELHKSPHAENNFLHSIFPKYVVYSMVYSIVHWAPVEAGLRSCGWFQLWQNHFLRMHTVPMMTVILVHSAEHTV